MENPLITYDLGFLFDHLREWGKVYRYALRNDISKHLKRFKIGFKLL